MIFLDKIKKSDFGKNVLTLMTGTAVSQIIILGLSPILSRLYSPSDFGVFAIYISIITIFGSVINGKFEEAILITKFKKNAVELIYLSLLINFTLVLILYLVFFIFRIKISNLLGVANNPTIIFFIPISIFLLGVLNVFYFWNNRNKNFKNISISRMVQSIVVISFQLIFSLILQNETGLILGNVIGILFATSIMIFNTKNIKYIISFVALSSGNLILVAKKYISFPIYKVPSIVIQLFSQQAPIYLLKSFFNADCVGFYSLGQRSVQAPLGIVGTSISQVFIQKASQDILKYGNAKNIFLKTLKILIAISFPIFLILYFISPDLFEFVFGSNWRTAGEYVQILIPSLFLGFVVSPLSGMFIVREKQKQDLILQVFLLFFSILGLFLGYYFFNSVKTTLLFYTIVYCIKYMFEFKMSYNYCKNQNI